MKEPTVIDETYIKSKEKDIGAVYVFWDIHSCERILIKNYWKFGKRDIIELNFDILLKGAMYLPEDIYIFDASYMWTMVMTHEIISGKRYCIKCGNIKNYRRLHWKWLHIIEEDTYGGEICKK